MGLIDFLFGGKKVSDVPFWVYNHKNGDNSFGLIDLLYGGRKVSDVPYWAFEEKRKAHEERLRKEQMQERTYERLEEIRQEIEDLELEEHSMKQKMIDDYIMDKVNRIKHNR